MPLTSEMPQSNEKLSKLLLSMAKMVATGAPVASTGMEIDGYLIPPEVFIQAMADLEAFFQTVCVCPECTKRRLDGQN